MSELHFSVIVLFSAMFSCFLLDSYEPQEIISIVSQNMEPLSLLSTSRGVLTARVMMNMLAIRYFFLMLEIIVNNNSCLQFLNPRTVFESLFL